MSQKEPSLLTRLQTELFQMQDPGYRAFQCRLLPTVPPETVIGVRTPALRAYAKELLKTETAAAFLRALPHSYFDENQLHAFLLSELRDYPRCLAELERFLPYVDNWATCDQLSPRVFRKHRPELLERIRVWLASDAPYTVRFGLGMLMEHFLDGDFRPEYLDWASALRWEDYYVKMMVAWYFATALAKQYESALPCLEQGRLDAWTHCKAIQKAIESRRIPPERKAYLKTLKRKPTGEAARPQSAPSESGNSKGRNTGSMR
jgi:3-methyladenine DNA glycosylase AlkD